MAACGGAGVDQAEPSSNISGSAEGSESLPAFRVAQQVDDAPASTTRTVSSMADATMATVTVSTAAVQSTSATATRAMWSWFDSDIATVAKQKSMLDFAAQRKINIIYVHSQSLLGKPALLAGFIDRAAARSVKVELLFGAPEWSRAENHHLALDILKRANAFVAGLTGARPVGLHFDIEPHGLPDWNQNQVSLGNQLIDLYTKMKAAHRSGLYLNADIAMGYEYVPITRNDVTRTLSHWMVDTVDRTTLMAYRDYAMGADSITSHAEHPISYALTKGKQTMVGVETTCNLEPAKITFCEEGYSRMESNVASVNTLFGTNAGYGGMAFHDYRALRALKR
ncbi:hypothetical protein JN27_19325 [Massilia sp. BSC265]|nr:hypothetical protein JN27_19325 [Massilia sp. BSC265]